MKSQKIVVVTGASRGIGLAICEAILLKYGPVKLYACSRAGKDLGLQCEEHSKVLYPKLDITQMSQMQDLASQIQKADGHVDVLINNAGLYILDADAKEAKQLIDVNYHGTLNMCETFLPLMAKKGARVVNVSSARGSLHVYTKEIQARFRATDITPAEIDVLAKEYLATLASGVAGGWGETLPYWVSKACLNAMTVWLARIYPDILVNCCCPGWVATGMGELVGEPPKTPAHGALIPLRLGFGDFGKVTGKFWSNPKISDIGDGQITVW